jgi:hypothetical protein
MYLVSVIGLVRHDTEHSSLCFELCEVDREDTSELAKSEGASLHLHTVICAPWS